MPVRDDKQYLRFADERTRPARELLARVPLDAPAEIADLAAIDTACPPRSDGRPPPVFLPAPLPGRAALIRRAGR